MTHHRLFGFAICTALVALVGCKSQSTATKFCLSAEGTYQDCGIACDVTKDQDACKKWADQTRALCAKISKDECNQLCTKDKNPTACEVAKTM